MVSYDPALSELAYQHLQETDKNSKTSIWGLLDLLLQAVSCVLVIDGLDEYENDLGSNDRQGFLATLKKHLVRTRSRVLIVSRDDVDIRSQLSASTDSSDVNLLEHSITKTDVAKDTLSFSKSVAEARLANKSQDIKDDIAKKLANKCDGMFLWIDLHQHNLRGGKNKRQLDRTIEELPVNLESIYQRNWREIQGQEHTDKKRAMNILRWALCALRPLRVVEITEALATANDEDDIEDCLPDVIDEEYVNGEILGLCGSFVELRSAGEDSSLASKTIHLKHFSVREFLRHTNARLEVFGSAQSYDTSAVFRNNGLALVCLRYLQCESVTRSPTTTFKRAFFDYAVWSWPEHIDSDHDQDVASSVERLFAMNSKSWEPWHTRFEQLWREKHTDEYLDLPSPSRVYYLASFNLGAALEHLLQKDPRMLNEEGGIHGTPIKAACAAGHSNLVMRLAKLGAELHICTGLNGTVLGTASSCGDIECCQFLLNSDVDVNKADNLGSTPIYLASMNGHIDVVRLLLGVGGQVRPYEIGKLPPLCAASKSGHVDIVKLLLNKGADVEEMEDGLTPLHLAASNGRVDVIRLLLSHKQSAHVNVRCNSITPLMSACINGSIEICELLLDHGADIEAQNSEMVRPLHLAVHGGHTDLTLVLLSRGAKVSATGQGGYPAIVYASLGDKDDQRMMEALIEHGADVEAVGENGIAALMCCCMQGHTCMARVLLENGANVSSGFEQTGDHPLAAATWHGHNDIVNLLLDHGADILKRNRDGFTALHDAARSDQARTVSLLIDRGANVDEIATWDPPRTSLQWASREGYLNVVRTLLDHGADINLDPSEGFGALGNAAYNGHIDVVELLVQRGAEINVKVGFSPLEGAVDGEHYDVAKYLIEHGAKTMLTNVPNPLGVAVESGKMAMAQLLLEHTGDVNDLDSNGDHALITASKHGHVEIVQLLIDHGARISELGRGSATALIHACLNGHLSVTRLLLEVGADFRPSDEGWTPFNFAVQRGNLEIIQLLEKHGCSFQQNAANGWPPLVLAAFHGHTDVVCYFLENDADVDCQLPNGLTALSMASFGGHIETVKVLLNHGADVRHLENRGISVDTEDSHSAKESSEYDLTGNESPLIIACRRDDHRLVELLLSAGANPKTLDHLGCTAFDWALQGPSDLSSKELWGDYCSPTPEAVQQKRIVMSLLTWIQTQRARHDLSFENLARYLLKLGDRSNALIAFEQTICRSGDVISHGTMCFRCRTIITSATRYTCLSCATNDLCTECYGAFRGDEGFWRCCKHDFFPIVADEFVLAKRSHEKHAQWLESWLDELLHKYNV